MMSKLVVGLIFVSILAVIIAAYTPEQKAEVVEWYITTGKSPVATQRKFRQIYGRHAKAPDQKSIKEWYAKFRAGEGQTRKKKLGNKVSLKVSFGSKNFLSLQWVKTPAKIQAVVDEFAQYPNSSIRRVANIPGMPSYSSIQSILKAAKFHPFKLQMRHLLREVDKEKRLSFANSQLALMGDNPEWLEKVMFGDEAHFHVHGGVNKHNMRYWSRCNPFWYREEPLHSPRVTVLAFIGKQGVVGPMFFEGNVNQHNYLAMLTDTVLPTLSEDPFDLNSTILMQDGAPPHWAKSVRNWLNEHFPGRWMGRGADGDSNIAWPPYSPDLTPPDFFLWGFIKSKVYTTQVADLAELRARIITAFANLPQEFVDRSVDGYKRRLSYLVRVDGRSVEQQYEDVVDGGEGEWDPNESDGEESDVEESDMEVSDNAESEDSVSEESSESESEQTGDSEYDDGLLMELD